LGLVGLGLGLRVTFMVWVRGDARQGKCPGEECPTVLELSASLLCT